MKKELTFLAFLLMAVCFAQDSQPTTEIHDYSQFRLLAHGGIGFGNIQNESAPNYNLNLQYFEVLFNYKFTENYGIATGIGLNEFSGNGFNESGNFYHERDELRIPLLVTADYDFDDKIKAIVGVGLYGKTNTSDDFRFLNRLEKDVFSDWGFGVQANFGLVFKLSELYSFGLNFNTQSDFSDYEANTGNSFSGEQRMKGVTALGVLVMMQF